MSNLSTEYLVPSELQRFVDSGLLEILSEKPADKTVVFHIPQLLHTDAHNRRIAFTLIWIHPDFNSQFCHYYCETPGDLANFYLIQQSEDGPEELVELESFDDLLTWLQEKTELISRRP